MYVSQIRVKWSHKNIYSDARLTLDRGNMTKEITTNLINKQKWNVNSAILKRETKEYEK